MYCGWQVLIESYSSSGPYSIKTAVKAAFIQLLTVFVERLREVSDNVVSCSMSQFFQATSLTVDFAYCS